MWHRDHAPGRSLQAGCTTAPPPQRASAGSAAMSLGLPPAPPRSQPTSWIACPACLSAVGAPGRAQGPAGVSHWTWAQRRVMPGLPQPLIAVRSSSNRPRPPVRAAGQRPGSIAACPKPLRSSFTAHSSPAAHPRTGMGEEAGYESGAASAAEEAPGDEMDLEEHEEDSPRTQLIKANIRVVGAGGGRSSGSRRGGPGAPAQPAPGVMPGAAADRIHWTHCRAGGRGPPACHAALPRCLPRCTPLKRLPAAGGEHPH